MLVDEKAVQADLLAFTIGKGARGEETGLSLPFFRSEIVAPEDGEPLLAKLTRTAGGEVHPDNHGLVLARAHRLMASASTRAESTLPEI